MLNPLGGWYTCIVPNYVLHTLLKNLPEREGGLRNEHLVHDNCKVQKPEHVPFPKVLEVKPMVVGMRRGDSAAEKHGFQSGDIVPVKPSVDGLVVNDDDLKCHLMDPAAQPQQQIAEQEEQQVRNCTFFDIYSCAFGSN